MGAWGTGNFDNDTACDWAWELEESSDLSVIERAVEAVLETEFVDADIASEALAAIDTIARLKGAGGVKNSSTETVDAWVSRVQISVPKELTEKARKALTVINCESSELFELWAESDDFANWQSEIEALAKRLGA